jgi:hypothetical protein
MKRLFPIFLVLALAIPAAATAHRKPSPKVQAATKNAAWLCKTQRTTMGDAAFMALYGRNRQAHGQGAMRNAFGKCVSQNSGKFLHAGLFEPANGTLTVTPPVAPSTTETLTLTGTIAGAGARPIASGTLSASLTVDLSKAVTKHHATCAPAQGTITLSQASPVGTLVKTLTNAVYCTNTNGSALFGRYTLTGTGAFATASGTGVEALLANTAGSMHSVEFGTFTS